MVNPLGWLGPQAAKTGRALQRRTRLLLTLSLVSSAAIGSAVVFVFANFVIPVPELADESRTRIANLIGFAAYLTVAVVIGAVWGTRRLRDVREFLKEGRAPTRAERRTVLRGPLIAARINGALWFGAVIVFGVTNATFSLELGYQVALTVAIGGVITTAMAYLLSERVLRATAARAMSASAPIEAVGPGVAARTLISWALGTGAPLLGLLLVAVGVLGGDDVTETELAVVILCLSVLGLVFGFLVVLLAARAVADPIVSLRDAVAEVERGDLEVEVPVYDASEVGLLQAGFNRMVEGLRERERLREAFGTYLDPEVAERILEEGPALEGEEVEVTLMFLDVRDFTGFAERRPPQEVVSTLNRLFERVVPLIRDRGGHIDKYLGDGLLAVFGTPRSNPEHAADALAAAREIAAAVSEEFGEDLGVGVGLNSGTVVAGNIGGAGRLEFSVVGDAVNVAARIEAATRETGDTLLLSEETARLLGDEQKLAERPGIELKGKADPVTLYAPER